MINDSDDPITVNSKDDDNQKEIEDIAKAADCSKSRTIYIYFGNGNYTPIFQGSKTTCIYDCNGSLISIAKIP